MNTPIITISKEEAEKHYKEYLDIVKTRKEKYLDDLKKTYYHLSKERKILDIFEVFKQSGVNENNEPKLAIAPANSVTVVFQKHVFGGGNFFNSGRGWRENKSDVTLPSNTFKGWTDEERKWSNPRREIEAKVPAIPAHILPDGDLKNYYILFEVKEWSERKRSSFQKGDPYLLKRINANAFVILAEWDVTDVEAAILRGY